MEGSGETGATTGSLLRHLSGEHSGLSGWSSKAQVHPNFGELRQQELRRIPIPRTLVNRPEATLKPLVASRALPPTQGRSRLPPPIRPAPPCSANVQGTPYSQ